MLSFSSLAFSVFLIGATLKAGAAPSLVKRGSGKSGISWPIQEGVVYPVEDFFQSGSALTWWYDWNKDWTLFADNTGGSSINAEFIPMIFSDGSYTDSDPLQAGYSLVLGYNEPDVNGVTASDAAAQYKTYHDGIRASNPSAMFASPAMAYDIGWLSTWFSEICPGFSAANGWSGCAYAPEYVAVHAYRDDFADFQSLVNQYYTTFNLPVIVSEFACYTFDSGVVPTQQEVYDFMGQATQWLDETSWVYKYAWFGAVRSETLLYGVPDVNRLMDAEGNVTPLGQQYISGGHT